MALLNKSKKVAVALSGGVDSAVVAALLKQQGYEVVGFHMRLWKAKPRAALGVFRRGLPSETARQVAKVLDIPFFIFDFQKEFKNSVVDYFIDSYKKGITPNPCVVCNKEIKFGLLIEKALAIGADYIATGHYANKLKTKNEKLKILKARDSKKDQSYFLWQLNQKQLSKVLLPIGEITSKAEVRKLAKEFNLPVAQTKESQEVCFIKDTTEEFLKKYLKEKPGEIQNKNGQALGEHQGLWFYTIGQRKGIGLSGGPYFVVAKDFKRNILIVSKNEKDLLSKELTAEKVNWLAGVEPTNLRNVQAKIRYGAKPARIKTMRKISQNKYKIIFTQSQRAITPGQSVVFYKSNELLGGGIIAK